MKRINIELKIPEAFEDNQFLRDVYQVALKAKCKTFIAELQSMKQKWLLRTLLNPGCIDTTHAVTQLYSNLGEDGTWKKEFTDTEQTVALTTLVSQMKASIAKNTIALTNQTGKPPVEPDNPRSGKSQ